MGLKLRVYGISEFLHFQVLTVFENPDVNFDEIFYSKDEVIKVNLSWMRMMRYVKKLVTMLDKKHFPR